ncbi:two-component system, response regulator YesN [Paenibacillus sp. yr247]|uniref:response regulator transcription factor n=1 Tax=Paenibacillus sp. yr247 TaxID=1761880 RepID=UPI00088091DF|nr:response regulator [Paenibacillus sp. yr247]SDO34717.1 two-component system, response regulator YesN [Paenibacillus sp. yr247]
MNRILLVEDEPLFRKGLAKMISGSGTDWHVCGEAENGQEAERLIEQLQPDLVMTDIRMPLMDGLELLKRMKSRFPGIEFIVITGYQDFQYAQTALRYGALDLLIKPCSGQDIFEALAKVEVLLLEKQARLRKEQNEHQLLLEGTLRGIFLRFPYRQEVIAELVQQLTGSKLLLFQIMDYHPAHKQYAKSDVPLLQFAVLNIISELMEQNAVTGKLLLIEYGRVVLLMRETEGGEHVCETASETIQRLLGLSVRSHIVAEVSDITHLADLYEAGLDAKQVERERDDRSAADSPISSTRQHLISAQLVAYMVAGQVDLLKQYLSQWMDEVRGMPPKSRQIEALTLSFALQETSRKQLELEQESSYLTERMSKLQACANIHEIEVWMQAEIDRFLGSYEKWQDKYNGNAILKATRYMEEHYAEALPLQLVASQVHLNATYFSHLFKKETGRSFIDCLIELRMEKAKQLLSNTDLKITEISGMIGYDLPNYFAKLFKQTTGLSPKDYRKSHQK